MESLLQPTVAFIARHQEWAGPVLGLIVFLESLLIVGAFVPATPVLVVAGGLIAAGRMDPLPVIAFCVAGAVLGDAISFFVGRRLGARALRHPALRPHRRAIARTRLYSRRFGVLTVYVGRFFGPLRAFVPTVVGMLKMRNRHFQAANIASAVVWVLAVLAPGYFAAKGLAELELLSEADPLTLAIISAGLAAALAVVTVQTLALIRRGRPQPRPSQA